MAIEAFTFGRLEHSHITKKKKKKKRAGILGFDGAAKPRNQALLAKLNWRLKKAKTEGESLWASTLKTDPVSKKRGIEDVTNFRIFFFCKSFQSAFDSDYLQLILTKPFITKKKKKRKKEKKNYKRNKNYRQVNSKTYC